MHDSVPVRIHWNQDDTAGTTVARRARDGSEFDFERLDETRGGTELSPTEKYPARGTARCIVLNRGRPEVGR